MHYITITLALQGYEEKGGERVFFKRCEKILKVEKLDFFGKILQILKIY